MIALPPPPPPQPHTEFSHPQALLTVIHGIGGWPAIGCGMSREGMGSVCGGINCLETGIVTRALGAWFYSHTEYQSQEAPKEINSCISAYNGDRSGIPYGTRTPGTPSYNTVRNMGVAFPGISHNREGTGRAYPSPAPLPGENCEGTRREAPRLTFPCLSCNLSFYPRFLPCGVAILASNYPRGSGRSPGSRITFTAHHSHWLLFVLL